MSDQGSSRLSYLAAHTQRLSQSITDPADTNSPSDNERVDCQTNISARQASP